jgi:serine/threonine protein phosphatase PrpC
MTSASYHQIHAFACSDVGRVRSANEDAFFVSDLTEGLRIEKNGVLHFRSGFFGSLFAVADGMGGAAAGEMASRLCVRTLYQEVQEMIQDVRRPDDGWIERILTEAVGDANSRVYEMATHYQEFAGMGTTLTAVFEFQGRLLIGQIGDSRAYLMRRNQIRQLTRDQSLIGQMVSDGALTEEQARRHPERNILLQALGVKPSVELALQSFSLQHGDVVLLCSDGLHSQMSTQEIFDVAAGSSGPGDACLALVDLANERGGPDNITSVLVQFLAE